MSKLYNRIASVKIFKGIPAFIPSSYKDEKIVNVLCIYLKKQDSYNG